MPVFQGGSGMKHSLMIAVFCTLICCTFICCAQVQAGEKLPDMKGTWVVIGETVCYNDVLVGDQHSQFEGPDFFPEVEVRLVIEEQVGALLAGYIDHDDHDDKLIGVLHRQNGRLTVALQSYGDNNRTFSSGTVRGEGARMTISGIIRSAEEPPATQLSMCSGFFTARRDE
jgi:hypothetical protein